MVLTGWCASFCVIDRLKQKNCVHRPESRFFYSALSSICISIYVLPGSEFRKNDIQIHTSLKTEVQLSHHSVRMHDGGNHDDDSLECARSDRSG